MEFYGKAFTGLLILAGLIASGCKQSMVISEVDYSQPIESVLSPDDEGIVKDERYGLQFNMLPLQYMETQDTTSVTTREVRYIRGKSGMFYITAPTYQHVYLMSAREGALEFRERFKINETGIEEPAFNQRDSFVQLVNRRSGESYRLTPESMEKEESTNNTED